MTDVKVATPDDYEKEQKHKSEYKLTEYHCDKCGQPADKFILVHPKLFLDEYGTTSKGMSEY
jgi:hypothetical protein